MRQSAADPTNETPATTASETTAPETTATERVLGRIAVQPPYYDLRDLTDLGGGLVTAKVPPAPPSGIETGAVEAAQVARHLAILGSCGAALARDDDSRHHYLATRAHYVRSAAAPASVSGHDHLEAQAVATWPDRRTARATAKLATPDGQALHVLDVEYSVLTERMFGRLHPTPEHTDTGADTGRHQRPVVGPPAATVAAADDEGPVRLHLDAGVITPEDCAGHFPGYPAAPVAIVMGQLCRLAGQCALDRVGGARYRIEEGTVVATMLAAAGQRLELEVDYVRPVEGRHLLAGVARANGDDVGLVEVVVSVHPEPAADGASGAPNGSS